MIALPSEVHFGSKLEFDSSARSKTLTGAPPSIGMTASFVVAPSEYLQAIHLPSAETAGHEAELSVSRFISPPSMDIRHNPPKGSHVDRYTTHFPSGVATGRLFAPQVVNCLSPAPSMPTRQMSVLSLRFDSKTTKRPSLVTLGASASVDPAGVSAFAFLPSASMIQIAP